MTRGTEIKTVRALDWPLILTLLLISAALLWAGTIALQAWFYTELAGEVDRKITTAPLSEINAFLDGQRTVLERYEIVDGDPDRIRLPIERAMELIRQEDQEAR